jgi:hypothetical protein
MIARRLAGSPASSGGQYATTGHPETGTTLDADTTGMVARVVSHFREMKLTSAARMAQNETGGAFGAHDAGWARADADIAVRLVLQDPRPSADEDNRAAAAELLANRLAHPDVLLRCRRMTDACTAALAQYAFDQALTAHTQNLTVMETHDRALADADPTVRTHARKTGSPERFKALGARNAYALSYAQLVLGSVDDDQAGRVADRFTLALEEGLTDPADLQDVAWDLDDER